MWWWSGGRGLERKPVSEFLRCGEAGKVCPQVNKAAKKLGDPKLLFLPFLSWGCHPQGSGFCLEIILCPLKKIPGSSCISINLFPSVQCCPA